MKILTSFWILCAVHTVKVFSDAATDYNKVNSDGSFSFGLSNKDVGGHYHEASGSVDKIVRGRYGSRSPASGRIEDTVYTAGPRGFRARGPLIHRKMDLSQYPRGPIGTPDDPLADPYEDPSYSFNFRTAEQERKENADSTGTVRGLYSYLDDIGELHTVRYAAGAGIGFEVLNAVPDSPANVAYSAPLYKTRRDAPGRMATERGPDGQYRFLLAAPDHRRSESSGPDGVVRGSYSYLDDKGIQRTVQYIAGAGIGYRVVKSATGAGTHLVPTPAIPNIDIRDHRSNDLSDDGYLKTSESGRFRPGDRDRVDNDEIGNQYGGFPGPRGYGDRSGSSNNEGFHGNDRYSNQNRYNNQYGNYDQNDHSSSQGIGNPNRYNNRPGAFGGAGGYNYNIKDDGIYTGNKQTTGNRSPFGDRTGYGDRRKPFLNNRTTGYDYSQGSDGADTRYGQRPGHGGGLGFSFGSTVRPTSTYSGGSSNFNQKFGSSQHKRPVNDFAQRDEYSPDRNKVSIGNNSDHHEYYDDYVRDFPKITTQSDRGSGGEWKTYGRDSTLIKNVGRWYLGLPPGASVRAQIHNIDLAPLGERQPSPSDALRRDQRADSKV